MVAHNVLGTSFQDGDEIIKQGSTGDCLYVIQSGKVEVIEEDGDRKIKVAQLGQDDFFGEMALFEKDVRSCTVRAIGEVNVLTLDKRNFYKTIQKDPSLAFKMLEKMANRLRRMNEKLL